MVLSTEDNPDLVFLNFVLALEIYGLTEHDSSPSVPMFRVVKQERTLQEVWHSVEVQAQTYMLGKFWLYYLSLCSQGEAGFLSKSISLPENGKTQNLSFLV